MTEQLDPAKLQLTNLLTGVRIDHAAFSFGGFTGASVKDQMRRDYITALHATIAVIDPAERWKQASLLYQGVWDYPKSPSNVTDLAQWIKNNIFLNSKNLKSPPLPDPEIDLTPSPMVNGDDYYCIINVGGFEYIVCYAAFSLMKPGGGLVSFEFDNGKRFGLVTAQFYFSLRFDEL